MGMRKDSEQHLLWTEAECSRKGIAVYKSNRGGDITYHGPGQIVGYPILSLAHRKDLHAYLRDIEEVIIRTLAIYGLAAARRKGHTGIWLNNERKICAIGVAVRSWVTYHGFALNVCPNMAHFDGIVPCGIIDGSVTSLDNELDEAVDIADLKARLAVEFKRVFRNSLLIRWICENQIGSEPNYPPAPNTKPCARSSTTTICIPSVRVPNVRNMGECWSRGTATVMILGNICTRSCTFCAIQTGRPTELDIGEPARVAESIARMKLKHAVITSVARDDLKDGGASVWAATIRAVHHRMPECAVEVLTADFRGQQEYLDLVLDACPDIFNHNLETVKRLQRPIRKTARYDRSLWVLEHAKSRGFITKSGIMLGIGEKNRDQRKCSRTWLKSASMCSPSVSIYNPLNSTPRSIAGSPPRNFHIGRNTL